MTSLQKRTLKTWGWPSVAVLALGILAGCSYIPDALNPVEWYQNTVDLFSGDEATPVEGEAGLAADPNAPAPAVDQSSSASTPVTSAGGGLAADTTNRSYTDEVQASQGAAVAPLDGSGPALAEAPPPPAMPAMTVTSASPTVIAPMPVPSQPTYAASTPPPAPAPMPSAMRQSFEEGLIAGLPAKPGEMVLPANADFPGGDGAYGTVVVSSSGIEDGEMEQLAAVPAMAPELALPRSGVVSPGEQAFDIGRLGVETMPQSGTVKVATILFENGSAQLRARDIEILQEVRAIHQNRGGVIRVVGHASSRTRDMDPIAHKMANFQISADRADVVAKALIKLGSGSQQVAVAAVSDTSPVYYEVMPSGEAGNRRTEIFITY